MVTRQRAYPSGRQVSCSASSENHTYVKEYTHVAQYLLFNHYPSHPEKFSDLGEGVDFKRRKCRAIIIEQKVPPYTVAIFPCEYCLCPTVSKMIILGKIWSKKSEFLTEGDLLSSKKCPKSSFQANFNQKIPKIQVFLRRRDLLSSKMCPK